MALLLLGVLAVVLMVAPSGNAWAFTTGAVGGPAVATGAILGGIDSNSSGLSSVGTVGASPGSVPGQSPVGEASVNPVPLVNQISQSAGDRLIISEAQNETTALPNSTSISAPLLSPSASASSSPAASGSTSAYGWIQGTVVAAGVAQTPLSGALVSAEPVTGFCPPAGCTTVQTGADGTFTVQASIGENEVLVSDGFYLSNRTWAYVGTGAYDDVGTIALVADGIVSGVLVGDDPAHEPVAGFSVTSITTDGAVVGSPSTHTNALGQFTVAVPPVPSEIDFAPILPYSVYEPNVTFVNVSSGASMDIGTVMVERATLVSYSILDSVTGAPIGGGAIQVCSRITGYCPAQGAAVGGSVLTAFAPVGPDVVTVYAPGYLLDSAVLGVVPSTRPGTAPIDMGSISLVPLGGVALWPNITGVSQPYGSSLPTSEWGVGGYAIVSVCSLDGLDYSYQLPSGNMSSSDCTGGCVPPGSEGVLPAIPLRNFVRVQPDEVGCLQPGYPTWPIPGDLPVFENYGWINVTPDKVTDAGGIDLLPGTYVEGQVLPTNEIGWDVTVCSTDEPNECGEGSYADSNYEYSYTFQVPNGCPTYPDDQDAKWTFCVAAPPGPDELRVTPSNASANYTWLFNPPLQWNLLPLPLSRATQTYSDSIDIGSSEVTGVVLQSLSFTTVIGLPSVQVCPAGVIPSAVICGGGVTNSTGAFSVQAPVGWDSVTVSAPDYEPNTTWVDVGPTSTSAGIILLVPYGYVQGEVEDPAGNGIYEATVELCPATNPNSCQAVGSDGLTSTGGFYYGATEAGPNPVGAYEVKATAPGYITDWTWVNVTTPGENFTAPTIVLQPVSSGPPSGDVARSSGIQPATSSTPASVGSWVEGSVVDADGGYGLPGAGIVAVPGSGATQVVFSSIRGTGGEFNQSLPDGDYNVQVAANGFYSTSVFLNVSGNASTIALGVIDLVPLPTVTGRLVITPAAWTTNVTYADGLGPGQGAVSVCTAEGTECQSSSVVSISGEFNATAPAGNYDLVLASGTGTGIGTFSRGFLSARAFANVTNSSISSVMPNPIGLDIYGIVTGSVVNANSTNAANKPVRYDQITADTTFPTDATQNEVLTADGTYAIIFPESNGLNMTAGGLGSWIPTGVGITVNGTAQGGSGGYVLPAGATVTLAPIRLEHFGWLDIEVGSGPNDTPVPYATVSASEPGKLWNLPTSFTASGPANGAGFLNLSLPPSIPTWKTTDALTVSAPDYGTAYRNVSVNASRTTYVNGTTALDLAPVNLTSWGWLFGEVRDKVTNRPLPNAAVSVTVNGLAAGKPGVDSNGLGDFLTVVPPGPQVNVSVALIGYSSNTSSYRVAPGETLSPGPIQLTGDGLVAGRVVSLPGDLPVSGATVSVCPQKQPYCSSSVVSNASGYFWVAAPPGVSAVTLGAPGFVTNTSAYVDVVSDSWIWIGDVAVQRYAYVEGTVLGLPSGLALSGATVSACAPTASGIGAGPCVTSVSTLADGSFYLQIAAGTYVLNASAPGYNATFLPIGLAPGETLPIGLMFVEEYGTATGVILGQGTGAPIAGAAVIACESWGSRACSAPIATHTGGAYVVTDPAGPIELEAVADGYQTSFRLVTISPGTTLTVPTWYLAPTGPSEQFPVSGRVTAGTSSGPPILGAVVSASGSTSTPVNASGDFELTLAWGTYQISASAPGYVTTSRNVTVESAVAGIDLVLAVQTFAVHGFVRSGLTGLGVAGVDINAGNQTLGVSGADGAYSLALSNGTHPLVAAGPSPYQHLSFEVTVTGAAQTVPILLYPLAVTVDGAVVNALNGLAVPSASVTVTGTTVQGTPWNLSVMSGPDGRFTAVTYPGAYTLRVLVAGYATEQSALVVSSNSTTVPVTLSVDPSSSTASGGVGSPVALWVGIGIAGAAVVAVGLVWATRRSPPPRRGPVPPVQSP